MRQLPDLKLPPILFQNDDFVVFNKPGNISLLADRSGAPNLWDTFKHAYGKSYLVHRLDKGTSGVLLLAKNQTTQTRLTKLFADHKVRKHYAALVVGDFARGQTQRIDLPLTKGRKSRYRVAGQRTTISQSENRYTVEPDREGLDAFTRARAISSTATHTLVALMPRTGRTHQLRVHLSWIGYPIVGDHLYGPKDPSKVSRLNLHCHKLIVPGFGTFTAELPMALTQSQRSPT